jgi:hypothetical protein
VSTHALGSPEPVATRALRYVDLILLALALPLFLLAGLPMIGYAVGAAAWIAQRLIRSFLQSRAAASDDPRTVAGLLVTSMLARGWLVALAVFGVGLSDNTAGLCAAVLCLALFSVYLSMEMTMRPFERDGGSR